jgi:hypothetical protein
MAIITSAGYLIVILGYQFTGRVIAASLFSWIHREIQRRMPSGGPLKKMPEISTFVFSTILIDGRAPRQGRWIIAHSGEPWGSLSGRVPTQKRCVERTLPGFKQEAQTSGAFLRTLPGFSSPNFEN